MLGFLFHSSIAETPKERAEQLEQLFRAAFPLDVLRGRAWVDWAANEVVNVV